MALIYDGTNGLTFNDGTQISSVNQVGIRNRIINGDMRIDQRNAGSTVTFGSGSVDAYVVDRFKGSKSSTGTFTLVQSSIAPPGFTKSLLFTVTGTEASLASSSYYDIIQYIEGYNIGDLDWGLSTAKTVTLSFWVRSSVTGTYSYELRNASANRSITYNYTINAANTWQQITQTIPGDTTGTWATDGGIGIGLLFPLASGSSFTTSNIGTWQAGNYNASTSAINLMATNGATFYITGVQLEKGSVATPFDFRFYGKELLLCQRYFLKTFPQGTAPAQNAGTLGTALVWSSSGANSTFGTQVQWRFPVTMRTAPTAIYYNPSAANANARNYAISSDMVLGSSPATGPGDSSLQFVSNDTASSAGHCCFIHVTASAEL